MPDRDRPFKPTWASIRDQHRTPALVQPRKIWQALSVAGGAVVLGVPGHVEHASTGGNLMLNVSPMGDGSIPDIQQKVLLAIGEWLKSNGEGIYDSHAWRIPGEGPGAPSEVPPDWKGGSTADQTTAIRDGAAPRIPSTEASFRFTTVKGNLYAFGYRYPAAGAATITSLSTTYAKVERVTLLGPISAPVTFKQTAEALVVTLPATPPSPNMPYTLRIEGSHALGLA